MDKYWTTVNANQQDIIMPYGEDPFAMAFDDYTSLHIDDSAENRSIIFSLSKNQDSRSPPLSLQITHKVQDMPQKTRSQTTELVTGQAVMSHQTQPTTALSPFSVDQRMNSTSSVESTGYLDVHYMQERGEQLQGRSASAENVQCENPLGSPLHGFLFSDKSLSSSTSGQGGLGVPDEALSSGSQARSPSPPGTPHASNPGFDKGSTRLGTKISMTSPSLYSEEDDSGLFVDNSGFSSQDLKYPTIVLQDSQTTLSHQHQNHSITAAKFLTDKQFEDSGCPIDSNFDSNFEQQSVL